MNGEHIKAGVLSLLDKVESLAISTLAEVGVKSVDVKGAHVFVNQYGVGNVGTLPDALLKYLNENTGCNNTEVIISDFSSPMMKAFVANDLLAYCCYARYGCNPATDTPESTLIALKNNPPDPWMMFRISWAISDSLSIMNDPERLKEHAAKINSQFGHLGGRPAATYRDALNSLIKKTLENVPPSIKNIAQWVFDALVGQSSGVIAGIELNNEGKLEIQVAEQLTSSVSPMFAMLGRGMSAPEEDPPCLDVRKIRDLITKIKNA